MLDRHYKSRLLRRCMEPTNGVEGWFDRYSSLTSIFESLLETS
uniref:Uncharacterized protein n=1 Tax=Vitis vinifera TaxID=29760 RepID=F6GW88_VITVI